MKQTTAKQHKTSDYIPYTTAQRRGLDMIRNSRRPAVGFYIIFASNTGLRAGDMLDRTSPIRHSDLISLTVGDPLELHEQKTDKYRAVTVNSKIVNAHKLLTARLTREGRMRPSAPIFTSQKNTVFAVTTMNEILKPLFADTAEHISTHSLRKSFGRHVYEQFGRTQDALVKLSDMFNHADTSVTRRYLGITKQEIKDVYMKL